MAHVITLAALAQSGALRGKRVFIRADLNVPFDDQGNISDDTRIRASVAGIQMALEAGALVMVTSHRGRPAEGDIEMADSLAPIGERLGSLLGIPVKLKANWVDGAFSLQSGQVLLLENCRVNKGEKKNDPELSRKMAALCDVYVNDAFGTAHRAEATTHGMAQFAPIACAGPLLEAELNALGQALKSPKHPMVAIVGGSKVSTKLSILLSLADKVDQLIVGGGIANTFLLAAGLPIGKSLAEPDQVEQARAVIEKMKARGAEVPIPVDVVVGKSFTSDTSATVKAVEDVEADDFIFDIGPATIAKLATILKNAGTIVWNGPLGVFEFDSFAAGTKGVSLAIAESNAFSIAGGGDTLAAIAKFGVTDKVDYISTGGGAFLEFLEGKVLPSVEVLESRAN